MTTFLPTTFDISNIAQAQMPVIDKVCDLHTVLYKFCASETSKSLR